MSLLTKSPHLFLLLPLLACLFLSVHSQTPKNYTLACGAQAPFSDDDGVRWVPDDLFISSGNPRNVSIPGLIQTLSTQRSFPYRPSATRAYKFCYTFSVTRAKRYLVRTTYFFGGEGAPPVFDQMVDATFWTMVNTTLDYAAGTASYYEGVFAAQGKAMSVCVAGNPNYTEADPFISALEMVELPDSVYNATDFNRSAMGLVARTKFGAASGLPERYPNDSFDRYWQSFTNNEAAVSSTHNITSSVFWNMPPADIFNTALVAEKDKPLVLQWPSVPLQNSSYYVALYFADTLPNNSRIFDVHINENSFYNALNVTYSGLAVFATNWILSGLTTLILAPDSGLPPLINAGELFGLFSVGRYTQARDAIALDNMKQMLQNTPDDWYGDPCMPYGYAWTGLTCDAGGSQVRVVALNFSNMGLSGFLSPSIANMTALSDISFAYNNLSGTIPDLGQLRLLQRMDLQNNQLTGPIPQSLGNINSLHELLLQNNNLTGQVPQNLLNKPGLNLQYVPGNHLTPIPPSPPSS